LAPIELSPHVEKESDGDHTTSVPVELARDRRGLKKMEVRVGIGLVVLLSMALGRIQAGQREQMRSLLAPVIRAA
jgi:hypothetical protein